ncbi:hypothetical protein [Methylomonas koyamae]|uniref:hypothetical protein n=1 Tax=Methylomonas koyamae TaxID=702114 RepID=UPI002872C0DD|nr:hypothetical protein [Methylomonas koyamae]WNB77500.1 hypothetical protein RI210_07945 [Methylomonas koyamae]
MANENIYRRFLKWLACSLGFGILAVLVFVVFVDPYDLYRIYNTKGVNAVKPVLARYVDEIKLARAVKLQPDTLILGNSRAEIGLDPESPALKKKGYSAYNLAIRGSAIVTAQRQLDYLFSKDIKPKRILIGVDFVDFVNPDGALKLGVDSIAPETDHFAIDNYFWRFDSLFSMSSLKDSISTLFIQNDGEAATMTERGFNPLNEYIPLARNEGYFVLFRQRAEENAKTYLRKQRGGLDESGFANLRAILRRAAQTEGDVVLIIYPYHAQILALFEETGLMPIFVQWKKILVEEAEKFRQSSQLGRIRVLDFSGYAEWQCEKIPAKGDLKSTTHWYWEAGHFKKALGERILERALAALETTDVQAENGADFGFDLRMSNFEDNARRLGLENQRCLGSYRQMFDDVKTLVQSLSG